MLFRRFKRIFRAVEHVHRYRKIVGVLLKYVYEDLAHRLLQVCQPLDRA
jgi:hypothetical protein